MQPAVPVPQGCRTNAILIRGLRSASLTSIYELSANVPPNSHPPKGPREKATMRLDLTAASATREPLHRDGCQPAIDRAYLARYTLGNLALEIEVLNLFAGQAPITLAELANAASEKAWRDAAHTLKGSARAVGAWKVAEGAEWAEALAPGQTEKRRRALASLAQALDEAIGYIAELEPEADM